MGFWVIFAVIWLYNNFWTKNAINLIKTTIESSHEHLDIYKILFQLNEPLKNYGSLYFTTFSISSICHTFVNIGTTWLSWLKPFSKAFLKKYYLQNFITTSWALQKWWYAQVFRLFLTNFYCNIFWTTNATNYFPKLVWRYQNYYQVPQKNTFVTHLVLKLIHCLLSSTK